MSTYLATIKLNSNGRVSLSPSALRNLGISTGDLLDIYYLEKEGCLLIKLAEPYEGDGHPPRRQGKRSRGKA